MKRWFISLVISLLTTVCLVAQSPIIPAPLVYSPENGATYIGKRITVNDAVAFAEQLAVGGFSAIISEQKLGWARGTDVLAAFSRQYPGTRTILFAASLPADTRKFQQEVGLSAWLQKSSTGFLRLPEIVKSMLQGPHPTEGTHEFWSQTIKHLDEAALTILADGSVVESNAAAAPTEMASCPMPLNHLEILPWRNWLIIFSSIIRGSMSCE